MDRDEFESWIGEHLSEAVEELHDVERSKKNWIVAFSNVLTRIAKEEVAEEEASGDPEAEDDDLELDEDEDEDEAEA